MVVHGGGGRGLLDDFQLTVILVVCDRAFLLALAVCLSVTQGNLMRLAYPALVGHLLPLLHGERLLDLGPTSIVQNFARYLLLGVHSLELRDRLLGGHLALPLGL